MELSIGFSTCPNDTFIFDALIHGKVDTEGLTFRPYLADVEDLNQRAFKQELDITKLSYHAFLHLTQDYILCNSGSALGDNNGPLLITLKEGPYTEEQINTMRIAIPGEYTTANLLLSLAYPEAKNKQSFVFSDIEKALKEDKADAGLIIHENRFTYEERGFKKIADMGAYWQSLSQQHIPLGGIVAKRSFDKDTLGKINRSLRRSVQFAFEQPSSVMPFVKQHAQEMAEEVMIKHIKLYVNSHSLELKSKGKEAIHYLFQKAIEKKLIKGYTSPLFID